MLTSRQPTNHTGQLTRHRTGVRGMGATSCRLSGLVISVVLLFFFRKEFRSARDLHPPFTKCTRIAPNKRVLLIDCHARLTPKKCARDLRPPPKSTRLPRSSALDPRVPQVAKLADFDLAVELPPPRHADHRRLRHAGLHGPGARGSGFFGGGGWGWGGDRCSGGGGGGGPVPDLPLASASSDMIGWSRVLLSRTLDTARSR